jgi:hypothetical protein
VRKTPTHFECAWHEVVLPLARYFTHCKEEHDGHVFAVKLTEKRCEHGQEIIDGFMFCCDYENW